MANLQLQDPLVSVKSTNSIDLSHALLHHCSSEEKTPTPVEAHQHNASVLFYHREDDDTEDRNIHADKHRISFSSLLTQAQERRSTIESETRSQYVEDYSKGCIKY